MSTAPTGNRLGHHVRDGRDGRKVGGYGVQGPAGLRDHGRRFGRCGTAHGDDVGPGLCQSDGDGLAQAGIGTGHHGHPPGQVE
jgi:hypothetical protein